MHTEKIQTITHPKTDELFYDIIRVYPSHPDFMKAIRLLYENGEINSAPYFLYYYEEKGDWYTSEQQCAKNALDCLNNLFKSESDLQYYSETRIFNTCQGRY